MSEPGLADLRAKPSNGVCRACGENPSEVGIDLQLREKSPEGKVGRGDHIVSVSATVCEGCARAAYEQVKAFVRPWEPLSPYDLDLP